jgi:radical SAM superfamily enzyme YgiQ (UPF0313 family)
MRDIRQVRSLGYRAFFLLDDNLMGNPAYFEQLCEQVKPLGMVWATQSSILLARNSRLLKLAAESGCRILSIGIESISQEGLNKANKQWVHAADHETMLARIANAGIMPATEMMVGLEGDTEESLRATADFVVRSKIPIPKFYMMTPMPGTDLYKQYKAEGRLLHEDYSRYTATDAVFRHDKLSPEKLEELYWYIYKKVYSFPNILRRTVLHRQFLRRPLSYLFALFVNLKYLRFIRAGNAPNIL